MAYFSLAGQHAIGSLLANGQAKKFVELLHKRFQAQVVQTLGGEASANFFCSCSIEGGGGAKRDTPIYVFPKREANLIVMSCSPAISAAVYGKMTELEEQVLEQQQKGVVAISVQ